MKVTVCVGSACHLKGSYDIIEMLQKAIEEYHMADDITLAGNFCTGKCNRKGVTITVDDDVYTGITRENFQEFFTDKILNVWNERK